jgi:hypothetical protein
MVVATGVLLLIFVVGLVWVAVGLRRWGRSETATEQRLLSPAAHTASYLIPAGEDPAVVMGALRNAGYTSVVDMAHSPERVLVECSFGDREKVRDVIAHVHHTRFDGSDVVERITFEDEG